MKHWWFYCDLKLKTPSDTAMQQGIVRDRNEIGEAVLHTAVDLGEDEELTDEQMLAVLQAIIATQTVGSKEATSRKRRLLQEVKQLVLPWASHG
jgi:hypothetical protein